MDKRVVWTCSRVQSTVLGDEFYGGPALGTRSPNHVSRGPAQGEWGEWPTWAAWQPALPSREAEGTVLGFGMFFITIHQQSYKSILTLQMRN